MHFRQGLGIFLFTTVSTQPPFQWVPGALSLGVKRQEREAGHSPPSSAEVKNAWSFNSIPLIRLHGVGQFYLAITFVFWFSLYSRFGHPFSKVSLLLVGQ